MNTNVVIPMAGLGSRFSKAGYLLPKPFIDVDGKMMVEHVLNAFSNINPIYILIIRQEFLEKYNTYLEKLKEKFNCKIVVIPRLTMGAAITALAAYKDIDPSSDIIFADSDNIFNNNDIVKFLLDARNRELFGSLLTFKSDNNCFSYAKINSDNFLIETKEKEVISSHAICGVYYFKNINLFVESVIDQIISNDLTKNEFYMSTVFNHLKKISNKIGIYEINDFYSVGTPALLNDYINKRKTNEKI